MALCITAGWNDVPHLTEAQKKALWDSYPAHERKARAEGVPMLGSGAVFPLEEARITCEPFVVPRHWLQIVGLDFGWDHPTAAVRVVWDRDTDTLYVTNAYRLSEEVPVIHATAIKGWGSWLPVAWPHDGLQYKDAGLKMLDEQASHEAGGNGVEAGIAEIFERMRTGRFKVFAGLGIWFEEFRTYHRAKGLIVKERDDLMAATRYGVMMRRFAKAPPNGGGAVIMKQRIGTVA
jgi:Terminase RNaseH-like domain